MPSSSHPRASRLFLPTNLRRVDSSGQYQNPGITRARVLPLPPFARRRRLNLSLSLSPPLDRFFFLPLHRTRPLFVRGEKKILSQLPFHAPHGSLRFFFHSRRGLPYLSLSFSQILEIRTPLSTDGSRVQRPARPIRVTNSRFFPFFLYIHVHTYSCTRVRPPFIRYSSFPSCSCAHRLAVEPSQCGEKNFIENLLNGTTENWARCYP